MRPPLELDLVDLSRFPKTSLVATLECVGNGRAFLHPTVGGEQWRLGAVSTARWSGIRLGDLLLRAALPCDAGEVRFDGADGTGGGDRQVKPTDLRGQLRVLNS